MPSAHTDRLVDAARRAGDRYVDFYSSERFHANRLSIAHDREEAQAKIRHRRFQGRRAFAVFIDSVDDLIADGGADYQAKMILEGVLRRTAEVRHPATEGDACNSRL